MSTVRIATNFNIDIEFTAPAFFRRLLAWLIDIVVLIFYVIIAYRFLFWFYGHSNYTEENSVILWAVRLLLTIPFIVYHLVLEATMNGQSIGKKIVGIKVVSENGGRPSIGQFIIRWLIRTSDYTLIIIIVLLPYVEIFGPRVYWGMAGAVALLITDLYLVNTKKHQRLGDILAHTVLINTIQKEKITDTVFLEIEDRYVPRFPQIMQLSDRDINALKRILDTARKQKDHNMAVLAAEKIKAHLKMETDLEAGEFLEILLKDYNSLSVS